MTFFIDKYNDTTLEEYTTQAINKFFPNPNFSNNSKVNLIIRVISFIKMVYKKKSSLTSISIKGDLINQLFAILNYKYSMFYTNAYSKIEEKNQKLTNLKEKINQSKYSNYYSISKSWINTYLFYKTKCLNNKLNDNQSKKTIVKTTKYFDNTKKIKYNNNTNIIIEDIDDYFYEKKIRKKTILKKKRSVNLNNSIGDEKGYLFNKKSEYIDYNDISFSNYDKIFKDEKNQNKREIMINIIDLFNVFLSKNQETLILNFINFYKANDMEKLSYEDFLKNCVLPINYSEISHYVEKFISEDKNTFNTELENMIINFNKYISDKTCFVHNLIITFNICYDLELQTSVLNLIYK